MPSHAEISILFIIMTSSIVESIPYAAALRKLQARARGIVYGMSLGISRAVLRC